MKKELLVAAGVEQFGGEDPWTVRDYHRGYPGGRNTLQELYSRKGDKDFI